MSMKTWNYTKLNEEAQRCERKRVIYAQPNGLVNEDIRIDILAATELVSELIADEFIRRSTDALETYMAEIPSCLNQQANDGFGCGYTCDGLNPFNNNICKFSHNTKGEYQ